MAPSTLRIAQRWTFDVHGVAVVPKTAEQCFYHRPAAQKVGPLIVDQVGGDDGGMLVITLFHQLEKNIRLLGFQGQISKFVNKCCVSHLLTNVKLSVMW